MSNFTEVSVGDGILELDGVDAGYIRNVTFTRTLEMLTLETGNPKSFQGSIPVREVVQLSADFLELSMENFSRFMGIGANVVTGGTETIADGDNQHKTFAAEGNYTNALERIFLDGINIANLVIKSTNGVTTYVAGTDYILDGTGRGVIRMSTGSIPSKGTVHVAYDYDVVSSTEIRGGETFDLQRSSLLFRHPKLRKGTDLVIHHSIVEPSSDFAMNFNADDFIANNVTFNFVKDPTRSSNGNSMFTFKEVATGAVVVA